MVTSWKTCNLLIDDIDIVKVVSIPVCDRIDVIQTPLLKLIRSHAVISVRGPLRWVPEEGVELELLVV